jgi:hypothetical protein
MIARHAPERRPAGSKRCCCLAAARDRASAPEGEGDVLVPASLRRNISRLFGKKHPTWQEFTERVVKHYADHPIKTPSFPENIERVASLERDGLVFIDDLLDAEGLAQLKAGLAVEMEAIRAGKQDQLGIDPDYVHSAPERGRFRLYRVDLRVPETHVFRDNPVLVDLIDAYMGGNLSTIDLALEMRRPPPDWDRALGDLIPHSDHVFRELKIYLALDDISDDNGPIIYWTGTHRTAEWRRLPDYLASIGGIWAESSNILNQTTVENLMEHSPEFSECREVRCTIKAGSAFACDTRGLHRASYLKQGERWHIYSTYGVNGYVRRHVPNEQGWLQPLDLS